MYVTGKARVVERPKRGRAGRRPESVIIVGAGAAGECAAETLRRDGYEGRLTLYDPDPDAPYDRPNLSKDYLAGNASEDWIPLHPPEFYREREIEIVHERRVVAIEPKARRVRLDDGGTREFGALLLATGATPVRLPPEMERGQPTVHYLRSFADSKAIIAAAENAKRAVILGASFIGLEVAASLRARKLEVHVVAPDASARARIMGAGLGDFVRKLHEEHGVVFHLRQKAKQIGGGAVTLENGERLSSGSPGCGYRCPAQPRAGGGRGSDDRSGCARRPTAPDQRTGNLRRGRHRALARPAHRRAHSGRALGRRPAPGSGRRQKHLGPGRAVQHRPLLLEPTLRRPDQLRRARGELGLDRGRREYRRQGLRRAFCAGQSSSGGGHDLPRPPEPRSRAGNGARHGIDDSCHPEGAQRPKDLPGVGERSFATLRMTRST